MAAFILILNSAIDFHKLYTYFVLIRVINSCYSNWSSFGFLSQWGKRGCYLTIIKHLHRILPAPFKWSRVPRGMSPRTRGATPEIWNWRIHPPDSAIRLRKYIMKSMKRRTCGIADPHLSVCPMSDPLSISMHKAEDCDIWNEQSNGHSVRHEIWSEPLPD